MDIQDYSNSSKIKQLKIMLFSKFGVETKYYLKLFKNKKSS